MTVNPTWEFAARTGRPVLSSVEAEALAADLRRELRGEVRFSPGDRALYSADASNYRQVPIGVVIPRDVEDAIVAVRICREHRAPILARGGGTGQAGQSVNVAVVIDFSKYPNRVLSLDPDRRLARVEPGTILDDLRNAAERHHLTFGPDPSTHSRCTLGGMIGNDSCGVHSEMSGKTVDNVESLDVLTYDGLRLTVGKTSEEELARIIAQGGRRGEIYARLRALRDRYADLVRERFPRIPRRVSGFNLDQLLPENGFHVARALVGSENSCVIVLEAEVNLIPSPRARSLLVLGYPDIYAAADDVMSILPHKPIGLEGIDDIHVESMRRKGYHLEDLKLFPKGNGWLLVEVGAETPQAASRRAKDLMADLYEGQNPPDIRLFDDPHEAARIWKVRETALGATAFVPGQPLRWTGWEDSAVAPEKLGGYLRDLRALLDRQGFNCGFYGHFGQGCIHNRIDFDLMSRQGIAKFRAFIEDAADLVVRYGGSLSGEHGDGQSRAELYPKMFGPELVQAFVEFKDIWDPDGRLNPGKVVRPYRLDENLRLGESYRPPALETHFRFPEDGSFAEATLRCSGIGECRRMSGGTMCPSFMVTREEMHSTRGRARMLFEMLQGDPLKDGWRDRHVKEALDLCLACKGCKGDCPVKVDIATYKAEFLAHYYAGRLRPAHAYTIGLVYWWARLASLAPWAANFLARAPVLGRAAKLAGGIATERQLPAFASATFRRWFAARRPRNLDRPRVLLWPDCFNNHFTPPVGEAAVETLEAAGFQVTIPQRSLCCGRPLHDYGFLDLAKRLLRQVLEALGPEIEAGIPLVGLEPSCVAVFRDELVNFFPDDPRARRLSRQSYLLGEFLAKHARQFQPPRLARRALVHGHCHHKAIVGFEGDKDILGRLGLDCRYLEAGCCGMAGAFGFERGHYSLSMQVGERVLLPAVRAEAKESLVVADGFSCREQIAQSTDRHALHLAQVIQMALREDPSAPASPYPERPYLTMREPVAAPPVDPRLLAAGAGAALGAGLLWRRGRPGK